MIRCKWDEVTWEREREFAGGQEKFSGWSSVGDDNLSDWGGVKRMIAKKKKKGLGGRMVNSMDWKTDKKERKRSPNWRKLSFLSLSF